MSIVDQITRLKNAKAAIKQSLIDKGVGVSDEALLDEYPALIDSIEVGGGSNKNNLYQQLYMQRTVNETNMKGLFAYTPASSLDLSMMNTSKATDMSYMFSDSYISSTLMLRNFDTRNVTNMSYMFQYCGALQYLDISNFDMTNVTNTDGMFYMCTALFVIVLDNCDHDSISKIIYSSGFPTDDIGMRRIIRIKKTEAYELTPPENWEFVYVNGQVEYSEKEESLTLINEDIIQEVIEEQEVMIIDEEIISYDSDNENLMI